MSVVQNPLTGRMKQKLGGVVFTTWKGINVVKGKPLSVANPNTDNQQMRKSALSQIVAIFRLISGAVNIGFRQQAVRKSPYNAFTGYNLRNAFNYDNPPNAAFQATDMLISQGTIAQTPIDSVVSTAAGNTITVDWTEGDLQPGQSSGDFNIVVFYNVEKELWHYGGIGPARSVETAVYPVAGSFMDAGDHIHSYMFFYNQTSRKASDSTHNYSTVGA